MPTATVATTVAATVAATEARRILGGLAVVFEGAANVPDAVVGEVCYTRAVVMRRPGDKFTLDMLVSACAELITAQFPVAVNAQGRVMRGATRAAKLFGE